MFGRQIPGELTCRELLVRGDHSTETSDVDENCARTSSSNAVTSSLSAAAADARTFVTRCESILAFLSCAAGLSRVLAFPPGFYHVLPDRLHSQLNKRCRHNSIVMDHKCVIIIIIVWWQYIAVGRRLVCLCPNDQSCSYFGQVRRRKMFLFQLKMKAKSGKPGTPQSRLAGRRGWMSILESQISKPHMSSQYGELRPTSGWDLLASLRHPCEFQRVSRYCTAL